MKSIIRTSIALVAVLMVSDSQQVNVNKIHKKFLLPDEKKEEEPCTWPQFCYVPEVDFNPDHPPKEVVGGKYTQEKLKKQAKIDFWYDNAKSDTPMPNDISYE